VVTIGVGAEVHSLAVHRPFLTPHRHLYGVLWVELGGTGDLTVPAELRLPVDARSQAHGQSAGEIEDRESGKSGEEELGGEHSEWKWAKERK
ncbi:hypothetical protein FRC09_014675, partial [Ceratobasidium sp. 395]